MGGHKHAYPSLQKNQGILNMYYQFQHSFKYIPDVLCVSQAAAIVRATTFAFAEKAAPQGKDLLNRSYYPTGADIANVSKKWFVIDAEGQTLGRLACLAAMYIRCAGAAWVCVRVCLELN